MSTNIENNARDLEQELAWFARVLDTRFKLYFGIGSASVDVSVDQVAVDGGNVARGVVSG